MSAWIYIAGGIGAFIVFVAMFVLMSLADDWKQVNNDGMDSEGWDG